MEVGETTCTIRSCGHTFHSTCIQRWIIGSESSCPVCRTDDIACQHQDVAQHVSLSLLFNIIQDKQSTIDELNRKLQEMGDRVFAMSLSQLPDHGRAEPTQPGHFNWSRFREITSSSSRRNRPATRRTVTHVHHTHVDVNRRLLSGTDDSDSDNNDDDDDDDDVDEAEEEEEEEEEQKDGVEEEDREQAYEEEVNDRYTPGTDDDVSYDDDDREEEKQPVPHNRRGWRDSGEQRSPPSLYLPIAHFMQMQHILDIQRTIATLIQNNDISGNDDGSNSNDRDT